MQYFQKGVILLQSLLKGGASMPKWIEKECPRCHMLFTGYPAISRVDNTTEICSDCGIAEALEGLVRSPYRVGDVPGDKIEDRQN
jgi:hypothetical protein